MAQAVQEGLAGRDLAVRVAEELQPSFQFPDLAVAAVELDGERAVRPADRDGEPAASLSSGIVVDGESRGRVEVGYSEARPFLEEEEQLLEAVAEALSVWVARRDAYLRLEDRESRLRALFEHALDAIVVFGDDSVCVHANPAATEMTGYGEDTLVGMHLEEFVPEGREEELAELGRALEEDGRFSGDLALEHADGQIFVADCRVVADVRPGLHLGIMRDVTERVRAQAALEASEERFRHLAESAHDAIYRLRLEPEVSFEYVNPATAAISGYAAADYYQNPMILFERAHPEDLPELDPDLIAAGETRSIEWRFRRPDGTWIWLEDRRTPIVEDGEVVGVQGLARDISARKRTEQALREALEAEREATERLQRVDEMKDGFLRAISHELRTPVSALYGVSLTMQRHHGELTPERRGELLDRLAANAERLRRLLDDLLDVRRMAEGAPMANRRLVDLAELAAEVADGVEMSAHDLRRELREAPAALISSRIRRIIHALLDNVVRHTPAGTTALLRTERTSDGALLVVEDDGPGVPDEDKEQVFTPFWQGEHTRSEASPGTGIGLALVARMVQLHDGRAWVEDRPGGGARFCVLLPADPPAGSSTDV